MQMIDVGDKPRTERVAVAGGFVSMSRATLGILRRGEAEKGDVISAARLAGILAAKHTPDIVPLCHPISLSGIEVEVTPRAGCGRWTAPASRWRRSRRWRRPASPSTTC
jgi:cyclic pyranopterin phosphate synthase